MEKTKQGWRRKGHATALAQRAIRDAGPRRAVAAALGRSESTVSHEARTPGRAHPDLQRAFELLLALSAHPGVSARAFAEAAAEVVELRELVAAETKALVERGLYLLDREDDLECAENRTAKRGGDYAGALRAEGWAQIELAQIIDELAPRGVDLMAEYRRRRVS